MLGDEGKACCIRCNEPSEPLRDRPGSASGLPSCVHIHILYFFAMIYNNSLQVPVESAERSVYHGV